MKKKLIILLPLWILFVLVLAPVDILSGIIAKQKQVTVSGLKGTLWQGQIDQVDFLHWQFKDLDYSVSFFPLLIGRLSSHLAIHQGDIRGPIDLTLVSAGELKIDNANLEMSANQLKSFLPFPGVELIGDLATEDFFLHLKDNKPIKIQGLTHWTRAAIALGERHLPLGNYSIEWTTDDKNHIVGRIIPSSNQLSLQGKVRLSPQGELEFKGSIGTEIDQQLYNTLLFFSSGPAKNKRLPILFKKKIF